MGKHLETKGIVISEMPIGESDKRLLIFTPEHGKVTAFAKGCRKPTSRLLAVTQLFAYGEFEMLEGRNAYTLTGGEMTEAFYGIREDMMATAYGMYFLEFISATTEEGNSEPELYELLLRTLYALKGKRLHPEAIQCLFEIKALALLGYPVDVTHCSSCGSTELLGGIHLEEGRLLCAKCYGFKDPRVFQVDEVTRQAIGFLQGVALNELYKRDLTDNLRINLHRYADAFSSVHVGRNLRTKAFLNTFKRLD